MKENCIRNLSEWFKKEQREFPWRKERSPYTVLVSEIMLQQTRATAVLPFFDRWMKTFPSFVALARASEEEVIKAWEGLGYYSRARNLRNIAIAVERDYGGVFPNDLESILSFKGIGSYTAAAISHFAFGKRAVGADGNIKKVIARYYGYTSRIDQGNGILELLDDFLPRKESPVAFEALIELGATHCAKSPECMRCPLQGGCKAYQEGLTDKIPLVKKREKTIKLYRVVYVLEHLGKVVVKKEDKQLMKGLYEFPFLEKEGDHELLHEKMEKFVQAKIENKRRLKEETHSFTKYKATLTPYHCNLKLLPTLPDGCVLIPKEELSEYPFSSGHRKILSQL